ncbi:MAG: thioredoxin domain-containing protein [Deltaproteobacteria bacterium]|nr:thioredoxin domain-containing protein [Deltaproteobacteria bacterium]
MTDATTEHQQTVSRGFKVILVSFVLLSIIGMICAWHLMEVFRATHISPETHRSFCNISESMNCDEVALHDEFSVVLGTPVAVWGLAGFAFVALLALVSLLRARGRFGQGLLFLFGCLFLLVSLWLIYVMHFEIGSWCIVCLAIDAINLALLGLSIGAIFVSGKSIKQAALDDLRKVFRTPALLAGLAVGGLGVLAGAWLYGQHLQDSIAAARAAQKTLEKDAEPADGTHVLYVSQQNERLETKTWSPKTGDTPQDQACAEREQGSGGSGGTAVQVGASPEGFPWKGAREPVLEIHEFTDFQCPHCRRAHMMVNKLVARYPDRIRVYHRHLPLDEACNPMLDRPFHPRACELSKIAACAGQQGRFWEMDDYLFHNSPEITGRNVPATEIAKALELDMGRFECCMQSTQAMASIEKDIRAAVDLQLRGTPAYVIEGEVYYGRIPDEALGALNAAAP